MRSQCLCLSVLLVAVFCFELPGPQAAAAQSPSPPQAQALAQKRGVVTITLEDAIQMALQHNHNMLAARTTIQQSEAEETTANLRPNPSLFADWEYLPLNHSGQNSGYLQDSTEGDLGLSYLLERGRKRQHRLAAARDITAQTRSLV